MDLGLTGRTAVVPGATSGLGLAIARALAAEGAHIVLAGRREQLVAEHAAALPSAVGVVADLTDADVEEIMALEEDITSDVPGQLIRIARVLVFRQRRLFQLCDVPLRRNQLELPFEWPRHQRLESLNARINVSLLW